MARMEESEGRGNSLEIEAYTILKERLLNGHFHPGARMVEREVSDNLGMSRTPIRAALNQLACEGFLERPGKGGYRVRILDAPEALDMLDVREAIEGMAARLAARNASPEQRERLLSIIDTMKKDGITGGSPLYYRLCGDLHRSIFKASGNPKLEQMAMEINALSARFHYRTLLLGERIRESVQEHEAIAVSIANGEENLAEQLTRAHVRAVKHMMESLLDGIGADMALL